LPRTPNGKIDRQALPPPQGTAELKQPGLPPRTSLEREVQQVWEELLNVAPLSVTDDFFEVGGDSLLAVQLFVALEQRFGVKLPLGTLFQGATIEHLARLLERPGPDAVPAVVGIQTAGSRPPFFAVHGIGGEVLFLRQLASHLDPDQPVFGLQAASLLADPDHFPTVEELATYYVREMRGTQREGPYYLGGFSLGGTIAFEMAQQLRTAGEAVGLLALFDHAPRNQSEPFRFGTPTYAWRFLRNALSWLRYDLFETPPREMAVRLRVKLRSWKRRLHAAFSGGRAVRKSPEDFFDLSHVSGHERRILDQLYQAYLRYVPAPYAGGPVVLFRARAQPIFSRHLPDMEMRRWAEQSLTIHVMPGTHETMLREPYVRELAVRLQAALTAQHGGPVHRTSWPADKQAPSAARPAVRG
jgi:thioesterase domain-containing protein/acyl carrier protein